LAIASRIEKPLGGSQWILGGELSLGLLSWVKSSDGYAFSAPQKFLTEGKFNYEEDVNGFYKYGDMLTIGKYNRVKTNISLLKDHKRIRWGIHYDWKMKSYKAFTDGKIVHASHGVRLFVGFKFGREKQPTKQQ